MSTNSNKWNAIGFVWLMSLFIFAGCSSSDENTEVDGELVPINLLASLPTQGGNTRAGVGPIHGSETTLNISLFRADSDNSGEYTSSYDGVHSAAITSATAIGTAGKIATGLYYLSDPNQSTKLIGVYPRTADAVVSGNDITYTLDGAIDVLCSNLVAGNREKVEGLTMAFEHMLTQIVIMVAAVADTDAEEWGTVESISLEEIPLNFKVTLPQPSSGVTAASALPVEESEGEVFVSIMNNGTPIEDVDLSTEVEEFGQVMIPPTSSDTEIILSITTSRDTDPVKVNIPPRTYDPGMSHVVTLKFGPNKIIVSSVTIKAWEDDGEEEDVNVN